VTSKILSNLSWYPKSKLKAFLKSGYNHTKIERNFNFS